jgi:hypothetical protein
MLQAKNHIVLISLSTEGRSSKACHSNTVLNTQDFTLRGDFCYDRSDSFSVSALAAAM